ncbi:MAG: hypothetical protein U1E71_10005 [Ramlibacter sp.]|jgi:hypothetical protein
MSTQPDQYAEFEKAFRQARGGPRGRLNKLPDEATRNAELEREYKDARDGPWERLNKLAAEAIQHQGRCERDAKHFLGLYWGGSNPKQPQIELEEMRIWLEKNQPLDRWFLINLIELAGKKALALGYSAHKAAIASAKNAHPRAWVVEQWRDRKDKNQSKASFARQHASLVKNKFKVSVSADTIARDWIPKSL